MQGAKEAGWDEVAGKVARGQAMLGLCSLPKSLDFIIIGIKR